MMTKLTASLVLKYFRQCDFQCSGLKSLENAMKISCIAAQNTRFLISQHVDGTDAVKLEGDGLRGGVA